jgi:hypothetical protein
MSTWALGVIASVVAALLGAIVVRAHRAFDRLKPRRIARSERREVSRLLAAHLGIPTAEESGTLNRAQIELLARSFRLKLSRSYGQAPSGDSLRADELLEHIGRRSERIYLLNAESGYGKTVLGLTLTLLRSRQDLVPFFIDLAEADSDRPLRKFESLLGKLSGEYSSRPLFIFDALNETVDPVRFAESLASHQSELRRLGARLLFLFSFRHRSYPSRLRGALLSQGLGPLEQMELLFEPRASQPNDDLDFFPELVRARGLSALSDEDVVAELQDYCARFALVRLSREDLSAYLDWRYLGAGVASAGAEEPDSPASAPSPASLRFAAVVPKEEVSPEALYRVAEIAFVLLSEEATVTTYSAIARRHYIGKDKLLDLLAEAGLQQVVHCSERHIRFDSETTVRVLGALGVASLLCEGRSAMPLRGRTAYDTCAPHLQSALRWILAREQLGLEQAGLIADILRDALQGRDAPYSFYATALCAEEASVFGEAAGGLDTALFEGMIVAIDEDRAKSCRESLETAGRREPQPSLDPVLDQLFEVMGAYGVRAVNLLLRIMEESTAPLAKSQAAYLLLDAVGRSAERDDGKTEATFAAISAQMRCEDGNLHFRFHQVEILEAILDRLRDQRGPASLACTDRLREIAATGGSAAVEEVSEVYAECQKLVAIRADHLADIGLLGGIHPELRSTVGRCIALLTSDSGFEDIGTGAIAEARLECWEVVLGFAAYASGRLHRNAEFTGVIEAALKHRFWIVRWWAFAGLITVLKGASATGDRILTARCARLAAERLFSGIEPMGLKHRQCAVVGGLLEGGDEEAQQEMRRALRDAGERHGSPRQRQEFSERYYEAMGASPDNYLSEFFRRLEEIAPQASGDDDSQQLIPAE